MLTAEYLIACGIHPTQAKTFYPHLAATCFAFSVQTKEQIAGFVAEWSFESAAFTRLEEGLYYSKPQRIYEVFKRLRPMGLPALAQYAKAPQKLANLAYAGINGNGDQASGDGWRYRGSGLPQLTGRDNFRRAGAGLAQPYEEQPQLLREDPKHATMVAGWFWKANGLNEMMSNGWIDKVSIKINGGSNGLEDRRRLYHRCLAALNPN